MVMKCVRRSPRAFLPSISRRWLTLLLMLLALHASWKKPALQYVSLTGKRMPLTKRRGRFAGSKYPRNFNSLHFLPIARAALYVAPAAAMKRSTPSSFWSYNARAVLLTRVPLKFRFFPAKKIGPALGLELLLHLLFREKIGLALGLELLLHRTVKRIAEELWELRNGARGQPEKRSFARRRLRLILRAGGGLRADKNTWNVRSPLVLQWRLK